MKDKDEEMRELTVDEQKKFARQTYGSNAYQSSPYKYKPEEESAVKIRVVKKQKDISPKKEGDDITMVEEENQEGCMDDSK